MVCLLLAFCTAVVYYPVLSHDFLNLDDHIYVTKNKHVQIGLNLQTIKWAFTTIHAEFYHPITWISLLVDTSVYGTKARGYLITNLILHTLNTLLVFFVFFNMTGFLMRSMIVAVLFALHPFHVETVAWISDRKDLLSTFFLFMSIWAYTWYHRQPKTLTYAALAIAFGLAILSKPMVITLPCVLLLLDIWPLERLTFNRDFSAIKADLIALLREKIMLFIMAMAGGLIAIYAQKAGGGLGSILEYPMGLRLGNALISYASYCLKTIWPLKLAIFYPYPITLSYFKIFSALVLLIAITLIVLSQIRSRPYLFVGWFWFLIVLFPTIGILKIGEFAMADRYSYIAIIGLFIIVTWGCAEFGSHFRIRRFVSMVVIITIILSLGLLSSQQIKHWRNSEALYRHALEVTKDNYMAHYGLGHTLASQRHFSEAVEQFQKAARLKPDKTRILLYLGRALTKTGNFQEATAVLQDCLAEKPDHHEARFTLGLVFALENNYEIAARHFIDLARQIHLHNPSAPELKNQKAIVLYEQALEMEKKGRIEKALKTYHGILDIQPTFFPALDRICQIYLNKHAYKKALAVLHIKPERKWLMKNIVSGFNQWKDHFQNEIY